MYQTFPPLENLCRIVEEKEVIISETNQRNHDLQTELFAANIKRYQSDIIIVKRDIEECNQKRSEISKAVDKKFAVFGVVFVLIYMAVVIWALYVSITTDFSNKVANFIAMLSLVLGITPVFFSIILPFLKSKPKSLVAIVSKIKDTMIRKKCEQQGCTDCCLEKLKNELNELEKELESCKEKQDLHCFGKLTK